jgi:ribose transport system ATP-binding protein
MTVAASELALDMSGVSKRYGQTLVLDDVTFRVRQGSIHGLVGHNGAGKSTLMKIALGGVAPTTGSVSIGGKALTFSRPAEARDAGVGMVLQELSLIPTLSVADNIFLNDERTGLLRAIRAGSQRRAARDLLAELGLTSIRPSAVVTDLSIAEQQMIEIAKALRLTRRLLILDEPTAPLSFREVQRMFQLVRRTAELGVGVVFITHHLREIFDICDEMTVLRGGKVVLATRPAETSLGQVVRAIVGTELAAVERRERRLPAATTDRPPLLDVRDLSVQGKLRGLSFRVHPGEIVGVAGLAGSGRSVLLKALFGDLRPTAGTLEVRGRSYTPTSPSKAIAAGIYLIPEDRAVRGVISMHTIEQNAVLSILGRVSPASVFRPAAARAATDTMIEALDVRTTGAQQPVFELSGGNQQKVVLAKSLLAGPTLFLLDEPTFGVDVSTAASIIRRMREEVDKGGAVLWVSSDLAELIDVSDRVLILADGVLKREIARGEPDFVEDAVLEAIQRQGAPQADPIGTTA